MVGGSLEEVVGKLWETQYSFSNCYTWRRAHDIYIYMRTQVGRSKDGEGHPTKFVCTLQANRMIKRIDSLWAAPKRFNFLRQHRNNSLLCMALSGTWARLEGKQIVDTLVAQSMLFFSR